MLVVGLYGCELRSNSLNSDAERALMVVLLSGGIIWIGGAERSGGEWSIVDSWRGCGGVELEGGICFDGSAFAAISFSAMSISC